ncbi:energy transducer TonB [Seonamhaeicola sp.]|uniref:energy transducer TonB n=1 Tax=Seonamhaeicola sp. TaxID=1912245 RepID=UPI00261726D6|nr:energy transducer TonB [Seonamhaeicola sp.]
MRHRKESHRLIRQNEKPVKKPQKHEANLQKNSTLYFQVGLIVCLLITHGLFEMKFETKIPTVASQLPPDDPYSIDIPLITPEKRPTEEPVQQKKVKQPKDFIEVEDNEPIIEQILDTPDEPVEDKNPPLEDFDSIEEPTEEPIVDFVFIEEVPVYPGCENKKTNDARKKCMSEKLTKLIRKKFDTSLGDELGLSGRQTVLTQFTIDKQGNVIDIQTRAPHPRLNKEAERVINKVPKMKPGKQRDKPVKVRYTLPIIFDVQ